MSECWIDTPINFETPPWDRLKCSWVFAASTYVVGSGKFGFKIP